MKKLDEILDDLIRAQAGDMDNSFPVEQLSKQEAKSLIEQGLRGCLPKKREYQEKFALTSKTPKHLRRKFELENKEVFYYNLALSDVNKAIDEMCGEQGIVKGGGE